MTIDELEQIIKVLDPDYEGQSGNWMLRIEDVAVQIISAEEFDRMRIMVGIRNAEGISKEEACRSLQANFDSALDARYAIAQNVLWSIYIHPLFSLQKEQFQSALAQTISAAKTYGTSYSSGLYSFGGGDSNELLEKAYVEELKKNDRLN